MQAPSISAGFVDYPMVRATFCGERATPRRSGAEVELYQEADSE